MLGARAASCRRTRFTGISGELHRRACVSPRARRVELSFHHRRLQGEPGLLCAEEKLDYIRYIGRIEQTFRDLPLAALEDARVTRDFLEWRDAMAHSPKQADYAWIVLMRLLSWARARGLTLYRPPERVERLYHADRSDKIWTAQNIATFMAVAPYPVSSAVVLAVERG